MISLLPESRASPEPVVPCRASTSSVSQKEPASNLVSPVTRDHISHSSLQTYRQCPLKFYFKYVEALPEVTIPALFVFGRAVHAALELHFNELLAGGAAPNLDSLLGAFQEGWEEHPPESIKYPKSETRDSLGRLADRLLRAFLDSDFARPTGRIIGVEEELRGSIIPGAPPLLARLDLLTETDDAITVTDFKTARSAWSNQQVEDAGSQLLLYGEIVRKLLPHKQLRLQFMVATKTKDVSITGHTVAFNQHSLTRTKRIAERVWHAIEAKHFYPNPSAMNCPSCPFRDPCRRWTG